MTTIRSSIFETNSSSTHSITVASANSYPINDLTDTIYLGVGEYGWGYDEFTDTLTKADYLGVEAKINPAKWEILMRILNKYYPNVTFKPADEDSGHIDHQSYGDIWEALNYDHDLIEDFLMNPNSTLIISSDC